MTACAALTAAGAVTLIWYIAEKIRACSVKAVLIKSVVSALFVSVAACGWYSAGSGGSFILGLFVIIGLLFGLLGDIWLDFKYVFPAFSDIFTFAGFAVFGAGHLLYITGLLLQYYKRGNALYIAVPVILALLASTGNLILEKPMKLAYGKMKPTVFVYGAILFSTVFISGSLAYLHSWQETTLDLFFTGAVLFALSDLVLSGTYFGEGKTRPADIISNYVLYYGGQFLIAWSLLFMK